MPTPEVDGENSKLYIFRSLPASDLGLAALERAASGGCINVQFNWLAKERVLHWSSKILRATEQKCFK